MQDDAGNLKDIETVVRALATASRSLRLYPPASPIPRQSLEAVVVALDGLFRDGLPVLSLVIDREGFSVGGQSVSVGASGIGDLADALRSQGIAELAITPGCSAEQLLSLLTLVNLPAEEVRHDGGIAARLLGEGVDCVRVTDVQLTVVEQAEAFPDEDVDEFLRALARDPEKLAAWFAGASQGDPHAFEESLMELVRASGPSGFNQMLDALSQAFAAQRPESKDVLLGLALAAGPTRDLTGAVFSLMPSGEIAGSIVDGSFGRNMLSVSTALMRLPLDDAIAKVRADVQTRLRDGGRSEREMDFLEHMLEVRGRTEPETQLVDADRSYREAAAAAIVPDGIIESTRGAVEDSNVCVSAAAVRTMFALLDQQQDFDLYCSSVDSLAGMVPMLIEQGDLALATKVLSELSRRHTLNVGPWPELSTRLRDALAVAAGRPSMAALIRLCAADESQLPAARELLHHVGDGGGHALTVEAISAKDAGLVIAEKLLGRQLHGLLGKQAQQAQWFQLGPVVRRLASQDDPGAAAALEALMRRPDAQSRREVAAALAEVRGPLADRLMCAAIQDSSPEVVIVAARAAAKSARPGVASAIASRLAQLDIDNTDFSVGSELIAALARLPEPAADEALARLAGRRALIKRNRFVEVQDLVNQARAYRAQMAGSR